MEKENGSSVPGSGRSLEPTKISKESAFPQKKFLFVSHEALSGDLAWQVKKEGHEVKIFIESARDADVYEGILERWADWKKQVDWADVIVLDDTGFAKDADELRAKGKLVVGGSSYTDKLEEDREFGQNEMRAVGMTTLPHFDFSDFDEAIKFLQENPGRYVMKPMGAISGAEKDLLFISEDEDGKDLLEVMVRNKRSWSRKIERFQLQKHAVGVEIAVGAFFNGSDFILPVCVNFEHKRLFPGEVGPFTGEMGTLIYYTPSNPVFKETLAKMKDRLAVSKYVGYVDINCIANGRGIYPLEFTCRFGYPTISIQMEGILTPMGEFLYRMAAGEQFELRVKRGFQVGVVIAVPPFPFDDVQKAKMYKDCAIILKKPSLDGFHLGEVKYVDGDWKLAGDTGYALVITGSAPTVDEARKQVYNRIQNIVLQNMYYRTDIGLRWNRDSDRLQTWGYLF